MPVSGTRGPIPRTNPNASLADWMNYVEFRLKNLEGGTGRGLQGRLLERKILTTATHTVTFSDINQNYENLTVRWVGFADTASDTQLRDIRVVFNGDTGNNYHRQFSRDGTESTALSQASGKVGEANGQLAVGNENAGWFDVLDYTNSSRRTITLGQAFDVENLNVIRLETCNLWGAQVSQGEAITELTLEIGGTGATKFDVGSKFYLYGS